MPIAAGQPTGSARGARRISAAGGGPGDHQHMRSFWTSTRTRASRSPWDHFRAVTNNPASHARSQRCHAPAAGSRPGHTQYTPLVRSGQTPIFYFAGMKKRGRDRCQDGRRSGLTPPIPPAGSNIAPARPPDRLRPTGNRHR